MTTHAHGLHGPISQLKSGLIGLGAALAILGVLAIAAPWVASTVMDYMVGGALIAAGVTQLGSAASTLTWRGFWLTLLCGGLSLVAGTAMLAIPVEGVHAMATFLGLVLLFEAAAKLTAAFSLPRDFPWGWLLADGLVTAVLGGILLMSPTGQSGVYLGTLIGINLLSSGVAFLASGLWLKQRIG
jgi:uncharacterized membrane protein HdeD (DUF308 family)